VNKDTSINKIIHTKSQDTKYLKIIPITLFVTFTLPFALVIFLSLIHVQHIYDVRIRMIILKRSRRKKEHSPKCNLLMEQNLLREA